MNSNSRDLMDADGAWEEGQLVSARKLYASVREADPDCWHAAFQRAWIDAAFGPVPDAELAALHRPDLSGEARELLQILVDRVRDRQEGERLPGTIQDWDIAALARNPKAGERTWWESCADLAIETGQWGLAQACFDKAADVAPEMYHDPPRRAQGIQAQLEAHLETIRG